MLQGFCSRHALLQPVTAETAIAKDTLIRAGANFVARPRSGARLRNQMWAEGHLGFTA